MEKILFKCKVGSHAFGTNTPESDEDIATIFACDTDDILGFKYKEHDDLTKDDRRYEIGKFIRLLLQGNPNMLEILNSPDDCVLFTTPEFDLLRTESKRFITKKLFHTFVGYANTQIAKSKGLNKKINWEKSKITRKDVLDFCYVVDLYNVKGTVPLKSWLIQEGYTQEHCGLQGLDHFRYGYLLYVDDLAWVKKEANHRFADIETHEFKGIVQGEDSNDVSTSSIPAYCKPKALLYFNKDGYSVHCKEYKEYTDWLSKRNLARFKTNQKHGQEYDSKNIMHMVRLLNSAERIIKTGVMTIRCDEEEIKHLLRIKSGQENLEEMIEWAELKKSELETLFKRSKIPEVVDEEFGHKLLIKIRKV
jgi:uncharacterized protein